ncbi:MAG: hypothetical protein JRJ40_11315 [Deltaproteobacteria bacterium]|nr:hypothetical protein [Deltaproteobacteria bacterium]
MTTTTKNMIWKTDEDPEKMPEYDIARNVELRFDPTAKCTEIKITRETLRDDQISLSKLLEPLVAIELGVALIDAARKQLEMEGY